MNEEQASRTGSGKLLSKVVRFITSPTTDWADLDRASDREEATVSAAGLELKEMIERKRRNDFVRNRELNMLRKLRQHQASGSTISLSVSSVASSVSDSTADSTARGRDTLEKIAEIEEEMARAWLDRDISRHPDEKKALDQAETQPAPLAGSFAPTQVQLPQRDAASPAGPSEPMGTMLEMRFDDSGQLVAPGPGQAPDGIPVLSDSYADQQGAGAPPAFLAPDDDEEQPVELMLSPAMEDVAIRFANGDLAGAEASLLGALGAQGDLEQDEQAWLSLFDLYRAAGQTDKFDGAAMSFVTRFGRSAPQWQQAVESTSIQAVQVLAAQAQPEADAVPVHTHWTAPATLNAQTLGALQAALNRHAAPWRIDWRRVQTVEQAALGDLLGILQDWAESPVSLQFLGAEVLLQALEARSPTDDRETDPRWWKARLSLLQIMNEVDEFDLVALNYCVTYEVSPPAWEKPRCRFAVLDSSGRLIEHSESGASLGHHSSLFGMTSIGPTLDDPEEVARLVLKGELLGDLQDMLKAVPLTAHTRSIELDFRKVQRVDFAAAGDLLNWVVEQKSQGCPVVFRHVNRLVAAFLSVIGVADVARVMQRKD